MNESNLISILFQSKNETRPKYLLNPVISYIFLGIDVTLLLPLCYFHYLIWIMIKREKNRKGQNLVKHLLKCYSVIVPISFFITAVYINTLTRYVYPPWLLSEKWFCLIFEFLQHSTIVYIGGFSVFVASIKYLFIVHYDNAIKFGEIRARKIFFVVHLLTPMILALLNSVSNGNIDPIFWVDHCWTYKTDTENTNSSVNEKLENFFCVNREYDTSKLFGETLGGIVAWLLRGICGGVKVFYLMILSNLIELVLYGLIINDLCR